MHLWLLELTDLPAGFETRCHALMSAEERLRAARFRAPGARLQFCAGRALCRTTLSRYAAPPPQAWHFELSAFGRPRALAPDGSAGPDFNLAHTDGLVACVVGATSEVGVDCEPLSRRVPLDIADSFFAPNEVLALKELDEATQPTRFLEYWTLKEAYIKARGLGLSLSLSCFWFELDGAKPKLAMDARCNDTPHGWQFEHGMHRGTHMIAVAARTGADLQLHTQTVRLFE